MAAVNTGGAGGGGGRLGSALWPALAMSVSEDAPSPLLFGLYSQQGNTRCPDGARSNWNVSVPGGNPVSILMSPGPQKCIVIELRSKIALFFTNESNPNRPGSSD